jgi:hypothetical protein
MKLVASDAIAAPSYQIGGSARENTNLSLICARGYIVSAVNFASYGLPSNNTINENCHSSLSSTVLNQYCNKKYNCSVPATNGYVFSRIPEVQLFYSIFTDPCPGYLKSLNANVTCTDSNPPTNPVPTLPSTTVGPTRTRNPTPIRTNDTVLSQVHTPLEPHLSLTVIGSIGAGFIILVVTAIIFYRLKRQRNSMLLQDVSPKEVSNPTSLQAERQELEVRGDVSECEF